MTNLTTLIRGQRFPCSATNLFIFFLMGFFTLPEMMAQPCDVTGGTVATLSPANNLCLNDGTNNPVQLTVSGNVGIGRFGLVQASTGNVVATNETGLFEMTNYPPGNYRAGHVSVQQATTLTGITNINLLMGCYDLSNVIFISTFWVDGGTVTALDPTEISGGIVEFDVTGASGLNMRWALLNQTGSDILAVQTNGAFNFDNVADGTYLVAHAAFGTGVNLGSINPLNLDGCIAASNVLTVVKSSLSGPGEVLNPATGRTWMDRNLGASQVATSLTDAAAYGDLYQWGRGTDGHEKRNSPTTSVLSSSDTPGHGSFILTSSTPHDWRSPQNNTLWQGVNGINNPCPAGFRLATEMEWNQERLSWSSGNALGAFGSPLKLTAGGYRFYMDGTLLDVGSGGSYWSSTVSGTLARRQYFCGGGCVMGSNSRARGNSVRCTKD